MDRTYFLYSSDHGFQLGEFNILIDKRQPYDHDVRIHNLIRGPGIAPGSTFAFPGTNVDQAPTWLGLAGLDAPADFDGRSYAPLLIDPDAPGVPAQTLRHVRALAPAGRAAYSATWRREVFLEYYYNSINAKCGGEYPSESDANNWRGVRTMEDSAYGDLVYLEFQTGNQAKSPGVNFDNVDFIERVSTSPSPSRLR